MASRIRSLTKAVTYRAAGSLATGIIAYIMSEKLDIALAVGIADVVFKIFFYYLHERLWDHITWGRGDSHPEYTREEIYPVCEPLPQSQPCILLAEQDTSHQQEPKSEPH